MSLNQDYINIIFFVLFVIIYALYFYTNQNENLTNINNESLQKLSSVYSNGVLKVNSIITTGNVSVGGSIDTKGLTSKGDSTINGNLTVQASN